MTTKTSAGKTKVLTLKDYKTDIKPTWCPGCGDFGVLSALYKAMVALELDRTNTVAVSGIGCSSRIPYFLRTYGIHTVHGRSLPIAQGVKMANPELTVVAFGGDGDLFSIGAGHLPHAMRRNPDITIVMMDNETYGLTKGQTSPTSPIGHTTKSTPYGAIMQPMNPILTALSFGASFVARAYSAKPAQLTDLIIEGVRHKGLAFIHVESPCTEYNNTFDHFDSLVEELPDGWDAGDKVRAMELALTEEKVHLGVFFQEERSTYEKEFGSLANGNGAFDANVYLRQFG